MLRTAIPHFSMCSDGAVHQWRKDPPRKVLVREDLVAGERFVGAIRRAGAS